VTAVTSDSSTQPGAADEQTADGQTADGQTGVAQSVATLSVVRGEPTAEELAALVAVLASRVAGGAGDGESAAAAKVSGWTDRARYVRGRLPHSSDGWRASALPR
jgi:hypothetical protein